MSVDIYTDGSCFANPGPGGWAFYCPQSNIEYHDGDISTTNNIMELTAILKCFEYILSESFYRDNFIEKNTKFSVNIFTDSTYVRNGILSWMHKWVKNNWRTSSNAEVKNKEHWIIIHDLYQKIFHDDFINLNIIWVKSHSKNMYNNHVDKLAKLFPSKIFFT